MMQTTRGLLSIVVVGVLLLGLCGTRGFLDLNLCNEVLFPEHFL